jgi:hypothetical protein
MQSQRRRFDSAHAIALLALFVALAGGAYAATQVRKNSVTSASVRNGSLKGVDVKDDSLTGKDVKESSLGQVANAQAAQSAQSAQSAQTAASAQSFDGVRKIDYRNNQTGTTDTILSFRGMELRATCSAASATITNLTLDLHTTPAATANASMLRALQPTGPDPNERSGEVSIVRGGALAAGGTLTVIPGSTSIDTLSDSSAPNFIQGEGQIVYRTDADVVTVVYHAFVDHTAASTGYCELFGNAIAQ